MAKKVTKEDLDKLLPDWKVSEYQDGSFDLSRYSPEGEDVFISIRGDTYGELQSEAKDAYERFDPDDHASMIYHAKHYGTEEERRFFAPAPDSLQDLLKDAKAIKEMLKELAKVLEDAGNGKVDKVQK